MTTTKIKFCGLSRNCDIETANALSPDYVGFVFAKNSRRCVSFAQAKELKAPLIKAFGLRSIHDLPAVERCPADLVLLDSPGGGTGRPFGVDVSSGIETGGYKDREKMTAFAAAVREEK